MSDEKKDEATVEQVVTEDGKVSVTTVGQTGGITTGTWSTPSSPWDIIPTTKDESAADGEQLHEQPWPAVVIHSGSMAEKVAVVNEISNGVTPEHVMVKHRKCNGSTAQVGLAADSAAFTCGFCGRDYARQEFEVVVK